MPGFSFKKQNGTDDATSLSDAKVIIYEDASRNKYTFGVDSTDVFDTFKYESGGKTVDYSAIATEFMTGGGVGTLLGKLMTIDTNVGAINTNINTINTSVSTIGTNAGTIKNDVDAIKGKTGKIPDNLQVLLDALNPDITGTPAANSLGATLKEIKDKTDNMPDNLVGELGKLAKSTELTPLTTAAGKITIIETAVGKGSGSLGKALEELDTKVGQVKIKTGKIPDNLQVLLDALNPDITGTPAANSLGATLKEIKDKTDKLDLKNTDTNSGTLGEALGKLATAEQLSELDGKLITTESKTVLMHADLTDLLEALEAKALVPEPESPQSNSGHTPNEDMLGEYSHDQFLG